MKVYSLATLPRWERGPTPALLACVEAYRQSLARREEVYARVRADFPSQVQCSPACNECCAHFFYIRMLDMLLVRQGFVESETLDKTTVREQAMRWVAAVPDDVPLFAVGRREDMGALAALEESLPLRGLPCPLVVPMQGCQMYSHRPVICRSYGYPQLQLDGTMCSSCPKNLEGVPAEALAPYCLPSRSYMEVEDLKEQCAALLGVEGWRGFAVALGLALPLLLDPWTIDWPEVLQSV